MLHYYLTFSFHLKLALLTQLPTSNERKIPPHLKIKPAKFHNGGFTQDLYMHICSISVNFLLWKNSMNALKSVARTQRVNNNDVLFVFATHFKSYSFTTSRESRQQSRLVVNEDDKGKFRLERIKAVFFKALYM